MNIGLEYVRRKMSNWNQLYKDLKPKDRIVKIITYPTHQVHVLSK
jgi:hypothetical protein